MRQRDARRTRTMPLVRDTYQPSMFKSKEKLFLSTYIDDELTDEKGKTSILGLSKPEQKDVSSVHAVVEYR